MTHNAYFFGMHAVQESETNTILAQCRQATVPRSLLNKLDNGPGTMLKVTTKSGRLIATTRVDDHPAFRLLGKRSRAAAPLRVMHEL